MNTETPAAAVGMDRKNRSPEYCDGPECAACDKKRRANGAVGWKQNRATVVYPLAENLLIQPVESDPPPEYRGTTKDDER